MAVSDRTKNAKRNIAFGLINKFFSICVPFLTRTFLIKTIGSEYLGIDSLFTSILQILNLSELGFSSAVVYCMYKPMAENDRDTVSALLNLIKRIYKYVGLLILFLGLCLLPFLDCLIKDRTPSDISLPLVYLVFLFNSVISYLLFGYKNSLLNASQRIDVISNCASITKGALALFQGVALFLTYNYYYYICLLPLSTIANNLLIYWYVKKIFPQYYCYGKVSLAIRKSIQKNVMGLFAAKFCGGLRKSIETLSVSAFVGLTATAIYSNYYTLISALASICSVIATSLIPGIGNCVVTESKESNYQKMRTINFVYMWLAACVSICLFAGIQLFMKLWVGKELMFPDYVAILFPLYFYILRMGDIKAVYQEATGLWWENRYRAIFEVILNISLNIILIHYIGVAGVVIATIVSLLIVNFGLGSHIVFKYYFQNGKMKDFFKDHFRFLFSTMLSAMIVYKLSLVFCGSIWLCLVNMLLGLIVINLLMLGSFFKHPCLKEAWKMIINNIK